MNTFDPSKPARTKSGRKFKPTMFLNKKGDCVDVFTENCQYYGEWIKGEGGDICLYRAMDDHRLVGACLPWRYDPDR